eukprot:5107593-Pyramimonas_sp.AAC.1
MLDVGGKYLELCGLIFCELAQGSRRGIHCACGFRKVEVFAHLLVCLFGVGYHRAGRAEMGAGPQLGRSHGRAACR